MKRQFIKDIKPGSQVDDVFYCSRRDVKERRDGGAFLTLELRDKTGSVAGIMWDKIAPAATFYFGAGLALLAMVGLMFLIKERKV